MELVVINLKTAELAVARGYEIHTIISTIDSQTFGIFVAYESIETLLDEWEVLGVL